MAFTPKTATKTLTFTRPGSTETLTLAVGETFHYEKTEQGNEVIHTARVTRNGFVWTNVVRVARQPAAIALPAAPVAPTSNGTHSNGTHSNGHTLTAASVAQSGKDAGTAVLAAADRATSHLLGEERRVRRLAKASEMMQGKVYRVNYYIPEVLNKKAPNPAAIFRRNGGFSLDGSNWIFCEKDLNKPQVQEVIAHWAKVQPVEEASTVPGFVRTWKIRCWIDPYTPEQLNKEKEMIKDQLYQSMQDTHKSLIGRIEAASVRLQEAQDALAEDASEKDRDALQGDHYGALRGAVRDACERFESCLKGAELFDDTGSLDALFGAVRDAIRTHALAVNATLGAAGRKPVKIPSAIVG